LDSSGDSDIPTSSDLHWRALICYFYYHELARQMMSISGESPLQGLFDAPGAAELVTPELTLSATAIHHGANDWSRALRRAGITRGDRVICALPNGAAFVQLLIASLADGITLIPVAPHEPIGALIEVLDARIGITELGEPVRTASPSRTGGPPSTPIKARVSRIRTDGIAFFLRTSGTTAEPRWIALSETGVLAVLESHLPLMSVDGARVLCTLPWHHAFGLVLGLLPALLRARRIVTVAPNQRAVDALVPIAIASGVTHWDMVPLMASRLAQTPTGLTFLQSLAGGVVGGAPINAHLAPILRTTKLRVGYGQTEASPGITLGQPGEFRPGILGRAIGCHVRIDADGVLAYRGRNVAPGVWEGREFVALDPDRWQRSDDLVTLEQGVYLFAGRASATFKLSNGKVVEAPQIERALLQHLPTVTEVLLASRDGSALDVHYSTTDSLPIDPEIIRGLFGGLRSYIGEIRCVSPDAWNRTPKGEIDRRHPPA
jgi:acyl-CoA synthetase (AMP-forming)/AMP-acid ligase II